MKLEDVKVDQIVVDRYDNEYIVTEVDYDESESNVMPVRIKCIKFLKSILIQKYEIEFCGLNQSFWIYKSDETAKNDLHYIENCITVEELKLKESK